MKTSIQETKKDAQNAQRTVTPEFRSSYPHLFKPSAIGKSAPKYSITMLFKKTQDLTPLKKIMAAAKISAFGPNKESWPQIASPVQDGDETPDREGYKGHWVVKASSSEEFKPTVVDENVEEVISPSVFYAGCYAKAQIFARVYEDHGNGRGVHFILDMVQKTRDGKPFSGKQDAKSVFSPITPEAGDDGDDSFEDDDGLAF